MSGCKPPSTAYCTDIMVDSVCKLRICSSLIAVCFDKAKEQAKEYGHDLERELYYLVVHGCLHLFGYDHVTDELKQEMRTLEEKILTELGVLR